MLGSAKGWSKVRIMQQQQQLELFMCYIHPATHQRALAPILIVCNLLLSTTTVAVGLASPSLTPIRFLSPPTTATATATATGPPFSAARHQAHREGGASTLVRPTTEPRLPRPPKVCQRRHSRSKEEEEAPSASTNHHHHRGGRERKIERRALSTAAGEEREKEHRPRFLSPPPPTASFPNQLLFLFDAYPPRQRYVCVPPPLRVFFHTFSACMRGHRPSDSLGGKILPTTRRGTMKIASGRGRKNHCQGMESVWKENFLLFLFFLRK